MPERDTHTQIHEFQMSSKGVNLDGNLVEIAPEECIQSQNCLYLNGMVKRGGQSLVCNEEVSSGNPISGIHRYYKADGSKQLLASAGTNVKYLSGSAWIDTGISLTEGHPANFTTWGALDKVYICNGVDPMQTWDGTTAGSITLADGVPTQVLPYQDRLLSIIGGKLTWSASFDDSSNSGVAWNLASACGVKPDTILYGMHYHSINNQAGGFLTDILLAGASGMYLFEGADLRTPGFGILGDYVIYDLGLPVGCHAPKTMCWTPFGTIWLGSDKQVYILPYSNAVQKSMTPRPIGNRIQSSRVGISGIESIPTQAVKNASAVYHDGYYILSFSTGNQYNDTQYWLDVYRLFSDPNGHTGPWYGPMKGQSISCFTTQSGQGDSGEVIGGESQNYGYVYYLNQPSVYSDIDPATKEQTPIEVIWQSFYNPLGLPGVRKDVHNMELEIASAVGPVVTNYYDIGGQLGQSASILDSGATYFGDDYFGNFYFNAPDLPVRLPLSVTPPLHTRRLSVAVRHNISNDIFQLFALRVQATEQNLVFE